LAFPLENINGFPRKINKQVFLWKWMQKSWSLTFRIRKRIINKL